MTLTVDVTAEDIARGKPSAACYCPVARALVRVLPYGARPAVSQTDFHILAVPEGLLPGNPASVKVQFPSAETDAIRRYDLNMGMRPHTFMVEIPDPLAPQEPRP